MAEFRAVAWICETSDLPIVVCRKRKERDECGVFRNRFEALFCGYGRANMRPGTWRCEMRPWSVVGLTAG